MVNLTRIYTRTGDDGSTRLGDMSMTSKLDFRLQAYADCDELNSHIGVALVHCGPHQQAGPDNGTDNGPDNGTEINQEIVDVLTYVQNDLFDVGADLSCPVVDNPEFPPLRVEQDYIDRLEEWCDGFNEQLPKLRSFILPGGTAVAAHLHVARTVSRRAERSSWAALSEHDDMNALTAKYLNRLSDLLFILARCANHANHGGGTEGDVLWVPGGERQNPQT